MMTDTQLTYIGIIGQAIPVITAIYLVTMGNWMIKRRDKIKITFMVSNDFTEFYN